MSRHVFYQAISYTFAGKLFIFQLFPANKVFSLSFTAKLISFYFDGRSILGDSRAVSSAVFVLTMLLLQKSPFSHILSSVYSKLLIGYLLISPFCPPLAAILSLLPQSKPCQTPGLVLDFLKFLSVLFILSPHPNINFTALLSVIFIRKITYNENKEINQSSKDSPELTDLTEIQAQNVQLNQQSLVSISYKTELCA